MVGRPGFGSVGGSAVEGGLQPRRERAVGFGVRPRPARRRHRLRAQLLQDLLPHFRVRADVPCVDVVEGEVARQQTLVVAGRRSSGPVPTARSMRRTQPAAHLGSLHGRLHGCGGSGGCLGCRGRGAQDERDSREPLPARFASPNSSSSSPACIRAVHRRALRNRPAVTGSAPGRYRIGPSLKMSMKLSVVSALPRARSRSAVLPPPSPGSRMCPPPSAIINGVMPR